MDFDLAAETDTPLMEGNRDLTTPRSSTNVALSRPG
jgi:hypothetical protein